MLSPTQDGPAVVVCNTCRHSREALEDQSGARGGARLAQALREAQGADERFAGIAVQETACLFACGEFCTIHIRAPGKIGYVLGRFSPDADAAQAILDYALQVSESEHGRVPLKQWPQGVKGHFITRIPPAGYVVA